MTTTSPRDDSTPLPKGRGPRRRRLLLGLTLVLAAAFGLGWAFIARASAMKLYMIPSSSMTPTLLAGDKVCVDERPSRMPNRGEIWLFSMPPVAGTTPGVAIKRVVGLPGETIEVRAGRVWIDGKALDEPYLVAPITYNLGSRTLGPAEYFMLGDNRNLSNDSHVWGPVPFDHFVGRAIYRVWPVRRAGGL
jgi:signal peptidase I